MIARRGRSGNSRSVPCPGPDSPYRRKAFAGSAPVSVPGSRQRSICFGDRMIGFDCSRAGRPVDPFRIPIPEPSFSRFPQPGDSFSGQTPRKQSCIIAPAGGTTVKRGADALSSRKLSRFFGKLSHLWSRGEDSGSYTGPDWHIPESTPGPTRFRRA